MALIPAAKAAGIGDVRAALFVIALLVGYVLLALAHPLIRCPRCLGKRVIRPPKGSRTRPRKCWLCDAHGIWRLPAATTVHRFYWAIFGDHLQERQKAAVAEQQKESAR